MLDTTLRNHLQRPLDGVAARLESSGVSPNQLTLLGLVIGVGACVLVASGRWYLGLGMWLLNRLIDGLDGPLARRVGPTDLGGFFDIIADMAIYGGIILAIGWHVPDARLAALAVFVPYFLNGSSFLAWSSIAERLRMNSDERTFHFSTSLTEGTETIIAMSVILAVGRYTAEMLWVWAALVAISVVQRVLAVRRALSA